MEQMNKIGHLDNMDKKKYRYVNMEDERMLPI